MISASVQATIYDGIIAGMQTKDPWGGPKGVFYLLNDVIVPYTPRPTVIRIETDRLGEPIEIEVVQPDEVDVGVDPRANNKLKTIVTTSSTTTVGMQLSRGMNKIRVQVLDRPEEVVYLLINATTIVALWEAFARVLYSVSNSIIEEQKRAIYSKLATRIFEPFVPFQDLLPDTQSLQIIATRLVARGLLHSVGTNVGVTDLIKALTLSTPIYNTMDKYSFEVFPSLDPWTNAASQFGGKEAHVWIPNLGIANWLAFLGYISNQPDLFTIVNITEDEVVFYFQGQLQRHQFDFDAFGTDFLTSLARTECFKSITVLVIINSKLIITLCAAAYTFDLYITSDSAIGTGRTTFDSGIPFDSNIPFDSDPIDPFTDGWVGLSLTGRFEQDPQDPHCLDTFVTPSTTYSGVPCCYNSYYTQLLINNLYNLEVVVDPVVTGFVQTTIVWTLEAPDTTRWDVRVADDGTIYTVNNSPRSPDSLKVTKPDLTEASFSITNGGVLQVNSPPDVGTVLYNTIYLKSPNSSVFWIEVTNLNELQSTQIL